MSTTIGRDDRLPAAGRRPFRSRRSLILAALLTLALAAAVVGVQRWRDGLTLFRPAGDTITGDQMDVGSTFYVGEVAAPGDRPLLLRLTAATPEITVNSAHADVRVVMCTVRSKTQGAFGAVFSLTPFCARTHPFAAGRYELSPWTPAAGAVITVLAVTPHTAGRVHVSGIRLAYEQGLRRGDQVTGIAVDTRTR